VDRLEAGFGTVAAGDTTGAGASAASEGESTRGAATEVGVEAGSAGAGAAAVLSARAAQRLCPYSSLRLSRQSLSRFPSGARTTTADLRGLDGTGS